jgi:hypothetical protein
MSTILILLLIIFIAISIQRRLPGGCSGDCDQGRRPCNCKNKNG